MPPSSPHDPVSAEAVPPPPPEVPVAEEPPPPVLGSPEDPVWSPARLEASVAWSVAIVLALVFLFTVLRTLPSIGWPLVLAAFGAYQLDPVVRGLVRRGYSRTVSAGVVIGAIGVGSAALIGSLAPLVVRQARRIPDYVDGLLRWAVPRLEALFGTELPATFGELVAYAKDHVQELAGQAGSLVGAVLGGSLSLITAGMGLLIIPVVGFYLLRGWPEMLERGAGLVPPRHRPYFVERMGRVDRMLGGFIRGQLTLALVLSVLYSLAMSVIGLKLALVVGLVTGIGNLVPYVGIATGLALATGFCVVDFGFDYHLLLVAGTFASLVATDSVLITPRVVGDRVGLSPAAVIVAVLTCGSLFGFVGVLLAVPSAALLKLVAATLARAWLASRFHAGAGPDAPG